MKQDIQNQAAQIRYREKPKDVFYTPLELAQICISMIDLKPSDFVLDNAAGKKVFYDNYPSFVKKDYCEITEDKSFFDYTAEVDWIITNPPYSIMNEYLLHSCKVCRKGFGYLIGVHNLTTKRIEMMNKQGFGLTKFYLCKVQQWFGLTAFVVFEKGKENIIDFERKIFQAK